MGVEQGTALFALPNAAHRDRCREVKGVVESAIDAHFGRTVPLELVIDGGPGSASRPASGDDRGPAPSAAPADEFGLAADDDFDPDDPTTQAVVESVAEARLLEAFPGAQPVED